MTCEASLSCFVADLCASPNRCPVGLLPAADSAGTVCFAGAVICKTRIPGFRTVSRFCLLALDMSRRRGVRLVWVIEPTIKSPAPVIVRSWETSQPSQPKPPRGKMERVNQKRFFWGPSGMGRCMSTASSWQIAPSYWAFRRAGMKRPDGNLSTGP